MKIKFVAGYAIDQNVDVVINSANGFLLLGTAGAGRIREKSRKLSEKEKIEYEKLLNKLPKKVKNWYKKVYSKNKWHRTYAQLSCLKLLKNKDKNEFRRGTAVLDKNFEKSKKIIHAVGLSYSLSEDNSSRKKATKYLVEKVLKKSFKIALGEKAKSLAVPVMCAREKYGIKPDESLKIILSLIKKILKDKIQKIIICFDSPTTKKYMEKFLNG